MITFFEWLLQLDLNATNYLATACYKDSLRFIMKIMEWSMHGVLWLCMIGILLYTSKTVQDIQVYANIFFALIFDMIVIGCVKLAFRRSRPVHNVNDMIAVAPYVDQFSFPSGHSSRGVMLTKILFLLVPMDLIATMCIMLFPVALAVSRVMLGRHYVSDVIGGLLIGALEGYFVWTFWLSSEFCVEIVKNF